MQQTMAEVWESSRSNQYSWLLPTMLCLGCVFILALSWMRNSTQRRFAKSLAIIVLLYGAMLASSAEITEKWRLRQEWGERNQSRLTEKERQALIADGANLAIGPLISGGASGVFFYGLSLIVSSLIVRKIERQRSQVGNAPDAANF